MIYQTEFHDSVIHVAIPSLGTSSLQRYFSTHLRTSVMGAFLRAFSQQLQQNQQTLMPPDIQRLLLQTLQDQRLTGSEKRALKEVIADSIHDAHKRALCRHKAFELAKREVNDPTVGMVLDWLEDVVKLFLPPEPKTTLAETYFHPGEACSQRIRSLLHNTIHTAQLCVFTITDNEIVRAIEQAHLRGVKVQIISDNDKADDLGSDVHAMDRMGIEVRLDRTVAHMHHKFAIFDNQILATGSYNWTRGAKDNMENLLVSDDPRFLASFHHEFERLWRELS